MVSDGISHFIELLLVLADMGIEGGCVYGRCPDCWRQISAENPSTLIGELLAHELQYHPEHADSLNRSRIRDEDRGHDPHGDDS